MVRGTLEHGAGTQVFRIFLPPSLSLRCARCCRPHAGLQPCSPLQPGSIGRHKSRDVARPFRAAMGSVGSQHLQEPSVASTPHRSVVMSFDSGPLEEVAAGVAQAQGSRARGIPIFTDSEEPVPDDRYRAVYFATLLAGVGFLLPYNSFITDVDYLHHKYPGTSIVFDMSLTYILVALVAVLLNNALVERLSLHTRITAGTPPLPTRLPALTPGRHMPSIPCVRLTLLVCYLLALGPLLFISICDVWLQLFSRDQAYAINLAAVGTVAFGCTVQQSSFYGYTGMLPKRYTQGVMTGETRGPPHPQPSRKHFGAPRPDVLSLPSGPGWARLSRAVGQDSGTAGVMVSLSRILTKLLLPDERAGTLIFFLVSAGLELLCFLLHLLVRGSRFVLYHTARPRPSHTAGYRVHHDVAAEDVHFEHQGPGLANGGSPKDSPAHEVTGGGGAYTRFDVPRPRTRRSWPSFRALLLHRYVVARVIWADMLSIAVTYFITLCLFPGLESEIHHCILGEWLPILIMAVFNLSDFVGKILAALPMDWQGTHLLACACLRVVFIPLFILCVYPSSTPALRHPAWPCILSLLMGISNGYFGSVPMILAAGKVSPRQRELAGNTMTVSYMTGLTLGSAVAYCTYSLTRDAHGTCPDRSAANASFPAGL
ncbi:equilibrative nucleoside transporter 4 isoform X2 [Sagmatias obliquidens]|uniref:equilibrative nucleoside transporter 4 isoform X2 n=1 Tax=Sagmatias obliquidens TaxID=3371155 RepID=UPI000F43EEC0|nr:equilibrative nucleoside transporter 4 isoform X2 [Lagenorhynchus obliquidens]